MDGVLCRDPSMHENDKGSKLIEFYKRVKPKFIPLTEVGYIITNRLEKHREVTAKWLDNNNVKYKKLIMKENEKEKHVDHKARKINMISDIHLYVESSDVQSKGISQKVKIPVWCIDNQTLYSK